MEYHDRRGDSLTTRATALLGFSGVILALLVRGGLPQRVHVDLAIRVTGIVTIGSLLVCAVACLVTLLPGGATAPGVDELRSKWLGWVAKERRGKVLGDIADSYLMLHGSPEHFPVGDGFARADRRATAFIAAAAAMLVALIALALLLFLIYEQLS
jgi:hypothetical protein